MPGLTVTYAGHSAIIFEKNGLRVAIDPWLQGNPLCPESIVKNPGKLDFILLSHGHSDHAGDAIRVAKLTGATVVATYELISVLISEGLPKTQTVALNKGGTVQLQEHLSVSLTNAFHSSSYDSSKGPVYAGEPCGVIAQIFGTTLFHLGDTALFADLKLIAERYEPEIAFIPIGDCFTMGPEEAGIAARMINARVAVPIHYKTFPQLTGTYEEFRKVCEQYGVNSKELIVGETTEI